jgi:hypothetical protein
MASALSQMHCSTILGSEEVDEVVEEAVFRRCGKFGSALPASLGSCNNPRTRFTASYTWTAQRFQSALTTLVFKIFGARTMTCAKTNQIGRSPLQQT